MYVSENTIIKPYFGLTKLKPSTIIQSQIQNPYLNNTYSIHRQNMVPVDPSGNQQVIPHAKRYKQTLPQPTPFPFHGKSKLQRREEEGK